ncbi:hypothetical protein [Azoarcus sp. KH32C]|uniref:hypothetical protein n=1 Tax=Azoarcus sp. KH32C TaxID=748247 RepID=UPI0002386AE2|nr:hypothetical protein [Azoarcus sp. KH32C]BAL26521.1 hypothetical protein AZKH_4242 [Azoarcus sp. KH32C]
MSTIIVGHFDQMEHLREAMMLLEGLGFRSSDYAAYYLDPPGQHGVYLLVSNAANEDEENAEWIDGFTGEGIGAYLGAFPPDRNAVCRTATSGNGNGSHPLMLAIKAVPATVEAVAVAILGHSVARRINRVQGTWEHGDWLDLDRREAVVSLLHCDPR